MADYNQLKNAAILTPTQNTSLGSDENRYTDVYLSGNVNVGGATINSTNAIAPRIASVTYSGDDTATPPAGGATLTINGSGFQTGAVVYVDGTIVNSVSVISTTVVMFTAPAKTSGNYSLILVNTDGASATYIPGINYSGTPTWSTASGSLGTAEESTAISYTVSASSDSTVTYSVVSGALPSGISLNSSTGVISGTLPSITGTVTYYFTIRANDAENQETDRAFSLTSFQKIVGQAAFTTPGTYTWTAPAGVTSVSVVAVGAGGGGTSVYDSIQLGRGGGGGLGWKNNITVTPGQTYSVVVGAGGAAATSGGNGGDSYFINATTVKGGGGSNNGVGGGYVGDGGGNGGNASMATYKGGGGAAGYSGNGGDGAAEGGTPGSGSGGGGAGGYGGTGNEKGGSSGGGVGIYGQGANGTPGTVYAYTQEGGRGGSGGGNGGAGNYRAVSGPGGAYGGGGGPGGWYATGGVGGSGAVRIIWGPDRAFPSTLTTDQ
jgi:hypothetical protein